VMMIPKEAMGRFDEPMSVKEMEARLRYRSVRKSAERGGGG
jgi:hypothetical protein